MRGLQKEGAGRDAMNLIEKSVIQLYTNKLLRAAS